MTPRERWLQRIMHARGVRPVGHANPADDLDDPAAPLAPVVPVQAQPPAPDWPPAGARRIPRTAPGSLPAPGQTITLAPHAEDEEPGPEVPVEDEGQALDDVDGAEGQDEGGAPAAPPVPAGAKPVRKILTGKLGGGGGGKSPTDDPSLRIAVFNLSAAAVGYGLSLAGIVESFLVGAERAALGVLALVLAVGAAFGAWWITRHQAVRAVLASLPYWPLIRLALVLGSAETGRRMAPVAVAWLNQYGTRWGLGPDAVSLLLTSGGIAFGLWWGIDRNLRRFHWLVRWFARIPLATAVVCTLRYGNPIT